MGKLFVCEMILKVLKPEIFVPVETGLWMVVKEAFKIKE